jgi:SAM-dependent methyltransferase
MDTERTDWLRLFFVVWLAMFGGDGLAAEAAGGGRFHDAAGWASRFDDPSRASWQKPDDVIKALALAPESVVADIGAGTGYFSVRLARALPNGRVYGSDIEPEMVRYLRERAVKENLPSLHAVGATRESPALPEPVDLALFVNVQGLMVNPGDYFSRLRALLKPGGRVAIIATRLDSPIGARGGMRASAEQIKRDMARQGYALAAEHDFLPYQYFIVFRLQD